MKNKIKLMLMVVLSMVVLTACGGDSPTKVVESYFKEIKAGENTDVAKYMLDSIENKENAKENENTNETADPKMEEAIKIYFSKLDAKVISEKIDGDNATVEVEMKGLNFGKIMIEVFQDNLSAMFNGDEKAGENMSEDFLAKVKDSKVETRKGKVNLTKSDKGWKINQDNDLISLVFGSAE
jgi:hypothetical protein